MKNMSQLGKQREHQIKTIATVFIAIVIAFLLFCVVSDIRSASAQESPQDRPLVRAMERQAKAQEEQAAAMRAIERHLGTIAAEVRKR